MSFPWRIVISLILAATLAAGPLRAGDADWIELFNGKDLDGWETSLGVPPGGTEPLGVGSDPLEVFRVVMEDGEPAIRISGEMLGGLTTLRAFEDYHLELEFKWGEQRFAPRAALPRDSGLLYHGVNGYHPTTGWIESAEFGILEGGETGDFWSVPGRHGVRVLADVEADEIPPGERRYPDQSLRFRPGAARHSGVTHGVLNSDDNEKPRGEWNTLELYCLGQTAVHVVNGTVNLVLHDLRRQVDGREVPLARGRLQLQSEGAEVYFRGLRLRPIAELPERIREAMRAPPPNTLSDGERSQGWRLLFDGRTLAGWRGYRSEDAPDGWQARDGALTLSAPAGDLVTTESFGDFELVVDWKISRGGNSGLFYRVPEAADAEHLFHVAPEYEIRDNDFWLDDPYTSAACYGLYAPVADATLPIGYWNRARIVVRGDQVEHWLNGERVVRYERNSDDWRRRHESSRFPPEYGRAARGAIGLQDHGDAVWFRNVKIRPLAEGDE